MSTQTAAITNADGTAWTFATSDIPSNTALAGRWHDLAFLMEGGPGGSSQFVAARPGVFTGPTLSGFAPNGFFVGATGSGLQAQVFPGAAVIERGTFSGSTWATLSLSGTYPYVVTCKAIKNFTCDAANSLSGTRIDRVDLQIADGPGQGDNSGTSFARVIYTGGTVGSGSAPNAPSNSIPLALITFPSGTTTTLTGGMITDIRRSTAPRGAIRVLLPGDSLSDASTSHGELRDTSIVAGASGIQTLDRWNSYTSTWDTIALLGGGSTGCRYQAAVNGTGIGVVTTGMTSNVYSNAIKTTPLVTPNAGFYQFTLNKAGWWSVSAGNRVVTTTGNTALFNMITGAASAGNLFTDGFRLAEDSFPASGGFNWDVTMATSFYVPTAGFIVSVGAQTSGANASIDRSATGTAERNFLTLNWEGP